jgi:protein-arginine kinase activator protein McsA
MDCQRCGQRKATTRTFVVNQDTAEYWELCEPCFELNCGESEAAGLARAQADPAATLRQMEANLGRALTAAERAAVNEYLAGPSQPPPVSPS